MNTPSPADPQPDEFPRELLAAYVDGELDAEGRAMVERWLADHPEANAEVEAQREFSPINAPLWELAEAPEPSPLAWAAVRRDIAEELTLHLASGPGRWRVAVWTVGGLLTAGVAAAVALVAFTPDVQQPIPDRPVQVAKVPANPGPEIAPLPRAVTSPQPEPVAGFAVLPMASDDDVILERVPDTLTGWLPVGEPPFSGSLVLASEEEVHLEEVDPSPAWPTGGPKMTTAHGDAPMIFAAKPR